MVRKTKLLALSALSTTRQLESVYAELDEKLLNLDSGGSEELRIFWKKILGMNIR
jgi:hypothetical protein